MRDLILHIGWPKTGTTTLQSWSASSAVELAGQGIAYYASRGESIGEISRKISKREDLAEARRNFGEWLGRQTATTILLSSEGLAMNDRSQIEAFIQPTTWRHITVVAYLRAQEDYLEGFYKQSVKWGAKPSLDAYLEGPVSDSADYNLHLAGWEAWCAGQGARLIVRLYRREALLGGDIRCDFLASCGFAPPMQLPPSVNVSPSRGLIELYLKLPPIHRLQQINREMVASGLPGVTGSGDMLSDAQRAKVRERFATGNEALRQRLFADQSELFPANDRASHSAADPDALRQLLLSVLAKRRPAEAVEAARAALG